MATGSPMDPTRRSGSTTIDSKMTPSTESAVERLVRALDVPATGEGTWEALPTTSASGGGRLFGGLLMAQALVVAGSAMDTQVVPGHVHAAFLSAGRQDRPVEYTAENVRDGRSVTLRCVRAFQCGREIARVDVTCHAATDGGMDVSGPPATARYSSPNETEHHPVFFHRDAVGEAFEFRERRYEGPVPLEGPTVVDEPTRVTWVKARETLPDDACLHAALLLYLSDFATAWGVGRTVPRRLAGIATTNHSVWFFRPVRVDYWNLIELRPASVVGWRGLVNGSVHGRDGRHAMTLAQEVTMRPRPE